MNKITSFINSFFSVDKQQKVKASLVANDNQSKSLKTDSVKITAYDPSVLASLHAELLKTDPDTKILKSLIEQLTEKEAYTMNFDSFIREGYKGSSIQSFEEHIDKLFIMSNNLQNFLVTIADETPALGNWGNDQPDFDAETGIYSSLFDKTNALSMSLDRVIGDFSKTELKVLMKKRSNREEGRKYIIERIQKEMISPTKNEKRLEILQQHLDELNKKKA